MTTTTTSNKIVAPIANKPIMVAATPGLAVQLLTAGSAACVADLITFPLDTAKVRLQVINLELILDIQSLMKFNQTPFQYLKNIYYFRYKEKV